MVDVFNHDRGSDINLVAIIFFFFFKVSRFLTKGRLSE